MDAVERTISYFQKQTAVKVCQDAPANTKALAEYIEVARTGGPKTRFLDEPVMIIDCNSTSGANAYELASKVVQWLIDFPDNDPMVSDVSVTSLYRNEWRDGFCYSVSCSMTINI